MHNVRRTICTVWRTVDCTTYNVRRNHNVSKLCIRCTWCIEILYIAIYKMLHTYRYKEMLWLYLYEWHGYESCMITNRMIDFIWLRNFVAHVRCTLYTVYAVLTGLDQLVNIIIVGKHSVRRTTTFCVCIVYYICPEYWLFNFDLEGLREDLAT